MSHITKRVVTKYITFWKLLIETWLGRYNTKIKNRNKENEFAVLR